MEPGASDGGNAGFPEGVEFILGGLSGVALLHHAFNHPIALLIVAIPLVVAVMVVLIVVREVQLFKAR